MLFIQSCAVYGLGAVDVALEQEFGEEGKAAGKKEGTGAAAVGLWLRGFTDERKPVSQTRYGLRRLIKLVLCKVYPLYDHTGGYGIITRE